MTLNIEDLQQMQEKLRCIKTLFMNYQNYLNPEQQRVFTNFISCSKELYELLTVAIDNASNQALQTKVNRLLKSNYFDNFRNALGDIQKSTHELIANPPRAIEAPPKIYIFPDGHRQASWESDWLKSVLTDKKGLDVWQREINALSTQFDSSFSSLLVQASSNGLSQGIWLTVAQRAIERVSKIASVPKKYIPAINAVTGGAVLLSMAYNTTAGVIANVTQMSTHFLMNRFGFGQRATRQAATIAATTSFAAFELYHDPSPENLLKVVSTAGGTTIGVLGADFLFDKTEQALAYGYLNYVENQMNTHSAPGMRQGHTAKKSLKK